MTTIKEPREKLAALCEKTALVGLFFQLVLIPLLVHPFGFDPWYKPKIDATYALAALVAAAGALSVIAGRRRLPAPPLSVSVFLAAYALSAIVSTVCSIDRGLSINSDYFRQEGVVTLITYAALPVLFAALVRTRAQAETLLAGLVASTVLIAAWGLLQYAGLTPKIQPFFGMKVLSGVKAVGSTLGNPNFLGKFLVLTAPLLAAFLCLSAHRAQLLLMAAGCTMAVATLVLTETRSSWGCFCLAVGLFMLLSARLGIVKKKTVLTVAACAAAGIALMALTAAAAGKFASLRHTMAFRLQEAFKIGTLQEASSRLYVWDKALDQIALRPWVGYGPDTHVLIMRQYNAEYNRRFNAKVIIDRVHNNYLDTALAQGLPGLAAYCGIVASFLLWLWRAQHQARTPRERILLLAVFSGYCGYLVNDFFSFSVVSVSPTFWALMGLTVALHRTGAGHEAAGAGGQLAPAMAPPAAAAPPDASG